MAKKNIEEAQVQEQEQEAQVAEGTQESTQQPANGGESEGKQPEVKQQEKKAVVTEQGKKVKIHTTEDIDCLIACTPYRIAKDKEAQVPADVAAILVNAKKAYRI